MSSFLIRQATEGDAATLALLVTSAFAEYRGVLRPEPSALRETRDSMLEHFAIPGAGAFIGMDGAESIACVLLKPEQDDLYFGRLAVLPSWRRSGLATVLVNAVEAEARRRGCPGVRLGVRAALASNQRLFVSLGYRVTAEHAHEGFTQPTWYDMRKVL